MPRKAPYRPNNEVSQTFNSGHLAVYGRSTETIPGYFPVEKLTEKYGMVRYEERSVSIARLFASRYSTNSNLVDGQNMAKIDRVLRVPKLGIDTQDVVITEDGNRYQVSQVLIITKTYPHCMDLHLLRIKNEDDLS